ncbi:MAG: uracil-DNA glycosylase [bacterium]
MSSKESGDKDFVSEYLRYLIDMGEETIVFPESKGASLKSFYLEIKDCKLCPLGYTRTNFVFGVGNPDAKLMLIGEAPGREEDLQGIPFVGRAGQLLDRILAAIKLTRSDVYIANILKCRPPNNRDPLPNEITLCLPYLLKQIEIIKPKLICCLGRISAQVLLNTQEPMNKLRGVVHHYKGVPLIATYHPAALLRNDSLKRPTWEDMKLLKKLYDELNL